MHLALSEEQHFGNVRQNTSLADGNALQQLRPNKIILYLYMYDIDVHIIIDNVSCVMNSISLNIY